MANSATPTKTDAPRKAPIGLVTVGIVAAIALIVIIVSNAGGTVRVIDGRASITIATVDECANSTFAIALRDGADFETAAGALFKALQNAEGVGKATAYVDDPRIEIAYCQSYTNEPTLRALLEPTGYIAPLPESGS